MTVAGPITKAKSGQWRGIYGLERSPAHADSTPSLKISDGKRKRHGIDLHCFAGCSRQPELSRQWLIFRSRTFNRLLWGDKS